MWSTTGDHKLIVVSSTMYNEIAPEPTVLTMPVVDAEPDTGFGVELGDVGWALANLIGPFRKTGLVRQIDQVGVQQLMDVNNVLFKVLATPD